MKNNLLRKAFACMAFAAIPFSQVNAQSFTQDFDDITNMTGWVMTNSSSPVGTTGWEQGTGTTGGSFDAYNGTTTSFISADQNNVSGTGTISNWLITPNRTFRNGDVISFYTRKVSPDMKPDLLEVRLSTNGASTNVGSNVNTVGDFTSMLMTLNPSYETGTYPTTWTLYTLTISGLPAPTSGRIAFRYYASNAGTGGVNSEYIGIDNVVYTPYVCPGITMSPASGALTGGSAGNAYTASLSQSGALGTPSFAITAGALPPGITLAANGTISGTPTATGTFNFGVTVSDASGCSASTMYSITIVCPANPTSLNGLPELCSGDDAIYLTQGSPAGGTYSGTGVTADLVFDPIFGSQTITYDYTDPYGCPYSSSAVITVNTPPAVSQTAFEAACSNGEPFPLMGGMPLGGTYSGTGVENGDFDPAVGTQTITYTYTDANGCSSATTVTLTVNTAPTVTLSDFDAICSNEDPIELMGASPAGGTYSGTGVENGNFDPSAGTQTITYTYTDANNCSAEVEAEITVHTAPSVEQTAIAALCSNEDPIELTGASPAGGNYSGTGVDGSSFDPAAGTQTIVYAYIDANNCSGEATVEITVHEAPTVEHVDFAAVCSNEGPIALTGGSPAGGVYSGTGVVENEFDPASGTQDITYTYTDANNCSEEAIAEITVHAAPDVTLAFAAHSVCIENSPVTLAGGLPAGGTYSGTAVENGVFNQAVAGLGTQQITYSYTDANGCMDTDTDTIQVESCLGIAEFAAATFHVYPNPGNGLFTIATDAGQELTAVQIFDVQGKLLENATLTQNGSLFTVDLTQVKNGMYVLRAMHNNQPVSKRLIKQ